MRQKIRHVHRRKNRGKIRPGNDPDDLSAVVDDGKPPHLLLLHHIDGHLDVVVRTDRVDRLRHHVAHRAEHPAAGHGAAGDVAVGDDADELVPGADGNRAAVVLAHQRRGALHAVGGLAADWGCGHDIVDAHEKSPFAAMIGRYGRKGHERGHRAVWRRSPPACWRER